MQRPLVVSSGFFSILFVDKIHEDVSSSDDRFHEERIQRQRRRVALQRLVELLQSMVTKGQTVEESMIARVLGNSLAEIVEGVSIVGDLEVAAIDWKWMDQIAFI